MLSNWQGHNWACFISWSHKNNNTCQWSFYGMWQPLFIQNVAQLNPCNTWSLSAIYVEHFISYKIQTTDLRLEGWGEVKWFAAPATKEITALTNPYKPQATATNTRRFSDQTPITSKTKSAIGTPEMNSIFKAVMLPHTPIYLRRLLLILSV